MAVNYAEKWSPKVDERFTLKSLTEAAVNQNYDWTGVDTVQVYSIPAVDLVDYTTSGSTRYGSDTEISTAVQSMLLTQDRAFSITIDRMSLTDTNGAVRAGKSMQRQVDEKIIPEIDAYRLDEMQDAAIGNGNVEVSAVTAANAYTVLLAGQEALGNAKVPQEGRIAFCSYAYYNFLKLDSTFMLASEIAMKERINGMMGMVDGVKLVPVPSSYLPSNVAFIMTHKVATVAPKKLWSLITHDNPVGINGVKLEGRIRYDAFILDEKVDAIYVHAIAEISA